jgi:flavin reductase (DIM6/NTAB) family NADH-FMN oxidoreductase RutF
MSISADEFKTLMRHWATGITVITTQGPDGPHGMTANSFTGVSLDPPLVLISVDRRARTHDQIQASGMFGVHILHTGQEELAKRCAGVYGEAGNQLADLAPQSGPLGTPLLDDCMVALECRLHAAYDGGDHTLFVGEVQAIRVCEGAPLLYFDRQYHSL